MGDPGELMQRGRTQNTEPSEAADIRGNWASAEVPIESCTEREGEDARTQSGCARIYDAPMYNTAQYGCMDRTDTYSVGQRAEAESAAADNV